MGWSVGFGEKNMKLGKGWRGMELWVSKRDGVLGFGEKKYEIGEGMARMERWVSGGLER